MSFNILFLSTDNAARSIIAEGMLNHLASLRQRDVIGFSGGASPHGRVDHYTLDVLVTAGVEIGAYRNKSWDEFLRPDTPPMRLAVTLADREIHKLMPKWPGDPILLHWPYPDLSGHFENDTKKRAMFELTRQALAWRMSQLLDLPLETIHGPDLKRALAEIAAS